MLKELIQLLTSKRFYLAIAGLVVAGALLLVLIDRVFMPAYTNYDEGITVPNVTRLSLTEAEKMLASYGLRVEIADRRSNSAFPADYVIDQSPTPAKIVKPNRKIYLTVNTPSTPKVEVPDVANLSYRNAEIQLQNYGLRVGTVSYEPSRFKTTVLKQSIPAGEIVEEGTAIDLTVSDGLGAKMVQVPDIVGLRLSEAQQELRKAGFRVERIRFRPVKEVTPNTVVGYTPNEDQIIEGEPIVLIVSERYEVREESESGAVQADTSYMENPDSSLR